MARCQLTYFPPFIMISSKLLSYLSLISRWLIELCYLSLPPCFTHFLPLSASPSLSISVLLSPSPLSLPLSPPLSLSGLSLISHLTIKKQFGELFSRSFNMSNVFLLKASKGKEKLVTFLRLVIFTLSTFLWPATIGIVQFCNFFKRKPEKSTEKIYKAYLHFSVDSYILFGFVNILISE